MENLPPPPFTTPGVRTHMSKHTRVDFCLYCVNYSNYNNSDMNAAAAAAVRFSYSFVA